MQKEILEEAVKMQRENLSETLAEISHLETKKRTILNGILFNHREILRVQRDIYATVQE
jgi:hypothetical protein